MSRGSIDVGDDRLTSRLEAFGDLVFGFSLSLIAIRLDVPSRRDWRRSIAQLGGALLAGFLLIVMHREGADFQSDMRLFGGYALPAFVFLIFPIRRSVRRLPTCLR